MKMVMVDGALAGDEEGGRVACRHAMKHLLSRLGASLAALASVALLVLGGCASDAQFTTRVAPELGPGRHTVSVLGVFKDGRMNDEAWGAIAPGLSAVFGSACPALYGAQLAKEKPALSEAIDDYARANGVSEELLDQLAPAAGGDLILVVTLAGRVTKSKGGGADTSSVSGGGPATSRSGAGPMSGLNGGHQSILPPGVEGNGGGGGLELSASLFSVRLHRSVALVAMQYTGDSVDDAVRKLAAKIAAAIPATACAGWSSSAPVDDHRIRELAEAP
jgi:hypothetical protein